MFEFLETLEKRRAFKKALKEVNKEAFNVSSAVKVREQVKTEAPSSAGVPVYRSPIKNPLRKPETAYVDLKYFKDWRKVEKVKSDNPTYKPKPRALANEDDDFELMKDSPLSSRKVSTVETVEKLSAIPKQEDKKVSSDIDNYLFKDKTPPQNKVSLEEALKKVAPKTVDKVTTPAPKETPKEENKNIKVEVINFENKKPVKPKSTRKPRGKNKRKFDADVITSVDWK